MLIGEDDTRPPAVYERAQRETLALAETVAASWHRRVLTTEQMTDLWDSVTRLHAARIALIEYA